MDFEGTLASLKRSMDEASFVKSAADLPVGTVVYVEMDKNDGIVLKDGHPTRLKYVVIAGAKGDKKQVCVLLINSDADYSDSEEWLDGQYPLHKCHYCSFLDYDSWLDCTDPKVVTTRKLKAKKAQVKGHLTEDDLKAVMKILKNCEFISPHMKSVFGISSFVIDG